MSFTVNTKRAHGTFRSLNQFFLAAVLAVVYLFLHTIPVFATESTNRITVASLNGDYAGFISGVGGTRPVSISGILSFNGDGTGNANTIWHLPGGTYTDRVNVPRFYPFVYDVDDKGIVFMQADGIADTYFAVTKTRQRRHNHGQLALEIRGMSGRLETSGANIVVGTGKRLPNRAHFDDSSLSGVYGSLGVGANSRLVTAIGYTTLNGNGTGSAKSLWNVPDPLNGLERQLAPITSTVSYTVDSNGIGRVLVDQCDGIAREGWFVITEAKRVSGGRFIATEAFLINSQLNPVTGDLMTALINRIAN